MISKEKFEEIRREFSDKLKKGEINESEIKDEVSKEAEEERKAEKKAKAKKWGKRILGGALLAVAGVALGKSLNKKSDRHSEEDEYFEPEETCEAEPEIEEEEEIDYASAAEEELMELLGETGSEE